MATAEGKVPVLESAAQAVRFLREHWRYALTVAAIGALVQSGAFLALGASLPWVFLVLAVAACTHAAFLNAALNGQAAPPPAVFADAGRVFGAMAIVGFFLVIVIFMVAYVAMSVLIAPYAEQVKAAGENSEQLAAILNEAAAGQPSVTLWAMAIGGAIVLLLTSRLYLAAPASVDQNRISVFDSWRWTKGNLLRIAAARVVLLAPALVLVVALQTFGAAVLGAPGGDPAALAGQAQGNPLGFALFYFVAGFVQIGVYGALEAGLAAYLYRGLRPPPPAASAVPPTA